MRTTLLRDDVVAILKGANVKERYEIDLRLPDVLSKLVFEGLLNIETEVGDAAGAGGETFAEGAESAEGGLRYSQLQW